MPTSLTELYSVSYFGFRKRKFVYQFLILNLNEYLVVRRKTIYEYHKVDLKKEEIGNGTAIYFSALPTCLSLKSCESCISNTINFDVMNHVCLLLFSCG